MGKFTIDAPNGKSYTIDGDNAEGALAALRKHLGSDGQATAKPSVSDYVPAAIKDVGPEVGAAFGHALQSATGNSVEDVAGFDPRTRGQLGPIEGLLRTGRQLISPLEFAAAPFVGAARSLIGHPMADLEHAAGTVINPEVAAKDNPQQMYETAKGDVDLAMSAGKASPAKNPIPSVAELKASASKGYNSPEVTSLEVKPRAIRDYGDSAQLTLSNEGFDPATAPKTFAILDNLKKVPQQSVVTGQNINTLRKMLGKAAESADATERQAASMAIDHLDDYVPKILQNDVIAGDPAKAAQTLETARGDYTAAKQSERLDSKVNAAEIRAAATDSGMNVANKVRQKMAEVVYKPKEQRGLLPEEVDQARQIAEGTPTQNALRKVGSVLGGGGGMGMLHGASAGAAAGAAVGGPVGAAIGATAAPALGHTLRALGNKLTLRQAEKLSEAIRSRAPLASSMQKFHSKAVAYGSNPNPATMSGIALAARNFSTNLRAAGFNVSPSDLIQGVQGSKPAGAQDEQQ